MEEEILPVDGKTNGYDLPKEPDTIEGADAE